MTTLAKRQAPASAPPDPECRSAEALCFLHDPYHGANYPAALLTAIDTYWCQWAAREGRAAPTGLAATAVAAYALGHRDGSLDAAAEATDAATDADERGPRAFAAGFFLCLALVLLGLALVSLRAL
jgi:hypothetical protein